MVCTMKPVHGSLNPCPDKLHGIGNPLVYEPLGLSFLICERGGHTTSHKGTCMKDPAGPSPVAPPGPLQSPLPASPAQLPRPGPFSPPSLPLARPSAPSHSHPLSSTLHQCLASPNHGYPPKTAVGRSPHSAAGPTCDPDPHHRLPSPDTTSETQIRTVFSGPPTDSRFNLATPFAQSKETGKVGSLVTCHTDQGSVSYGGIVCIVCHTVL